LPKDSFRRERARSQWESTGRKDRYLSIPFRKCPSCKQTMVQVKKFESKVVVSCKNCFLRYDFTKFPAFEEIDYYNKMLDVFREEVREGRVSPVAIESPEKEVGSCPLCNSGNLAIIERYSLGNRFVKCSNTKCRATFSLPYKGFFEPAKEACPKCGWPLLYWEFRSTGAFALFCFNPNCGFRSKWRGFQRKR